MTENQTLAEKVYEIVKMARSGEVDPLEIRLTESYRELQELAEKLDNRVDIDEMLNEILSAKVSRVQELARVLASPEIYVARLKGKSTKTLARLLVQKQPVVIGHLEHATLGGSLARVVQLIEALSKEPLKDKIPEMTPLPIGFVFDTEDSVFIEDLDRFLKTIPQEGKVIFDNIVENDEFDLFLKHFLYVIILVSQGRLLYNPVTREIWKTQITDAT
ncbi:MAG: hypothetical protein E4H14_09730 [Candidatus Thorarchaeota archaeon]|nr:MAG: hypothetical protein E4H14_09730 [Candidatus Thorarchaeota archaeon]